MSNRLHLSFDNNCYVFKIFVNVKFVIFVIVKNKNDIFIALNIFHFVTYFERIFWVLSCRRRLNRKIFSCDVFVSTNLIDRFSRNRRLNFERRRDRRDYIKRCELTRIFFIWRDIEFCRVIFFCSTNFRFRNVTRNRRRFSL